MLGHPFHHLGIACADIEAAAAYVRRAFEVVSDSGTVEDPLQNVRVRLFNEGLPGAIELVCGPPVERLIAKGLTYYHVCYTTPDIEASLSRLGALGAVPVSPPTPAVLFGGRRVAFAYTLLGLVEFLEDA
jgi:methylmalonyl-CoA/ethylmalonyl-CoA epimerase